MAPSEKFKLMVQSAKAIVEDFNDDAEDRALAWASAELSRLTLIAAESQREVERLRGELANANRESAFRGKSWSACADRLQGVRAERDKLMSALRPFAAFACDTFCGCYNCIAKEALAEAVRDE